MGHREDEVKEQYTKIKIETTTKPTEATASIEFPSQFHTIRD